MKSLSRWLLAVCVGLFLALGRGEAAEFKQMPADLDQVDIYLHTADIGNQIYTNFGHIALRVHDKSTGSDLVFNWGIFDFGSSPVAFGLNYYKGILNYKLGIYPYRWAIEGYKAEKRKIWQDKFYLTRDQKEKLLTRLIENARPENQVFAYLYFADNCATRIRDHLDAVMGGAVRQATAENHASQTFRDMVYEGYSYTPGLDLFLDIAMNSNIDKLMTLWERMFHPLHMRDVYLKTMNEGRPLFEESTVLIDFPRPESYPGLSFMLFLVGFGVPLSLLGIAFFAQEKTGKLWSTTYRLFALVSLPLAGFGALLGFLMPLTWVVSNHLDLHHNANMLVFWPFDFILLVWLFAILVQGHGWRVSARSAAFLQRYVLAHVIVTLLMPVLRLLGLIQQNVDRISVWILPPYLVMLFLLWRMGTEVKAGDKK